MASEAADHRGRALALAPPRRAAFVRSADFSRLSGGTSPSTTPDSRRARTRPQPRLGAPAISGHGDADARALRRAPSRSGGPGVEATSSGSRSAPIGGRSAEGVPNMSNQETNTLILRRYTAAANPLGRRLLNLHVQWERLVWRWLVTGAVLSKRLFDLAGSVVLILLSGPLLLLIALLVKLEDGGPVIFAQTRVGRFGREFKMFKFRSMCLDAEERLKELLAMNHHSEGVTFKIKDDPRITRVGKWLRKFSLDELPQFFNVLMGDMSLVGPRPPVPREVALYTLADRRRLAVKPGITCFWQIGGRSEIDFSGQVQLDVDYIESQSLWVDVKILMQTVPAVLSGKGAC